MSKHSVNKGFSLVELMVVILIIGIAIALSIPAFGRFLQGWRLSGSIDRLSSTLRTARSAAVMKRVNTVFQFDTDTNTYFYFEDLNGNGSRDNTEYRSATYELPSGITFQGYTLPSTIVTFGPKGNTAASGTITLQNLRGATRSVRIFGGTGNISTN